MIIQNVLGIDWKNTKIDEFHKHLEEFGFEKGENENEKETEVKKIIIRVLKSSKRGETPRKTDMNNIFAKIRACDHHDLCRLDQILTRMKNAKETEYEWGSIILDCKWEKI